jgi:hypothetical protein
MIFELVLASRRNDQIGHLRTQVVAAACLYRRFRLLGGRRVVRFMVNLTTSSARPRRSPGSRVFSMPTKTRRLARVVPLP